MSNSQFYSPGKLLISGEYLVLDGGLALAVPTRFGQSMTVTKRGEAGIRWISEDHEGNTWFSTDFKESDFKESSNDPLQNRLNQLFDIISELQPSLFAENQGYEIRSQLEFPRQWGLGSSSTLIANLANWADIDPYTLLERSFGGSGYDVAVAQADAAIIYQKTQNGARVDPVDLNWPFEDQLYFIYLNKKQDSREAIARYRAQSEKSRVIDRVNEITLEMVNCTNLDHFEELMVAHEAIIGGRIGLKPVQQALFADYPGKVKSLGGWGGDFVMATGDQQTRDYFKSKGFNTILPFKDLIKKAP